MIIGHEKEVVGTVLNGTELNGVVKKNLISPLEGWVGYVMRLFELEEGGYTPRHTHAWPHINYVVSGQGTLHMDGQDFEIESGSFAYVPGGKLHQFLNRGTTKFSFICIIPEEGES